LAPSSSRWTISLSRKWTLVCQFVAQLHEPLEDRLDRRRQRVDLDPLNLLVFQTLRRRSDDRIELKKRQDARTVQALEQNVLGSIRQVERLENARHRPDQVEIALFRSIDPSVLLRKDQDVAALALNFLKHHEASLPSDRHRKDLLRKENGVPYRDDRKGFGNVHNLLHLSALRFVRLSRLRFNTLLS
jgi:hypothetical protein